MPLEFQPSSASDIEAIAQALITGFNAPPNASFANRQLLQWKYFEPGPDWEGSRSFVLKKDGAIAAHCGVWPMNLQFRDQTISCNSFVDWVSDPKIPGSGVLLKKNLMKMTEASIVVGGSDDTREVVPRIGFARVGEVLTFSRVVHPLELYRNRPSEPILKAVARLARNSIIAKSRVSRVPPSWRPQRTQLFEAGLKISDRGSGPTPFRTIEYLNYWLRLPAIEIAAFKILDDDELRGYFLLTQVMAQVRVADIRIFSDDVDDWAAAYALATKTAASQPGACEVLAIASTPFATDALLSNGYQERGRDPFFLYDPTKKLANAPPIFLNLIDGDGAYLCDPDHPFLS